MKRVTVLFVMTIGVATLAAFGVAFLAGPALAQAVKAALVMVVNTPADPVPVVIVEQAPPAQELPLVEPFFTPEQAAAGGGNTIALNFPIPGGEGQLAPRAAATSNRIVVIEMVSGLLRLSGTLLFLRITTTVNGVSASHHFDPTRTGGGGLDQKYYWVFTEHVRLYADPGSTVRIEAHAAGIPPGIEMKAAVSGSFANLE